MEYFGFSEMVEWSSLMFIIQDWKADGKMRIILRLHNNYYTSRQFECQQKRALILVSTRKDPMESEMTAILSGMFKDLISDKDKYVAEFIEL